MRDELRKDKTRLRFFILPLSTFILSDCRVSPGECGFTSSDGNPGTNGVITKLAAERGIKTIPAVLQAATFSENLAPQ